jgi:large subunit ribosomal protein L9
MARPQYLLLSDVDGLGRKGEVITARPGYVRNFLLPQELVVIATVHTLRKQEKLRQERAAQALVDAKEAEALALQLTTADLLITVKVDPEGHMYGSVSVLDIAQLLKDQGVDVERRYIQLPRPIKVTGVHRISFKLKEGIPASCQLTISPESATPQETPVQAS